MLVGAALGCFQSRLGYRLRRVPPDRSQGIRAGLFSCIEPPLFAPVADIGRKRKWEGKMKLYTYYRSQASFRVRITLNLKGIAREDSFLHLEKGDQFADAYRAVNPQMVVPTLIDGDIKLFQSLAILEYLDERTRSRRYCRLTRWQGPGCAGSH